MKRVSSKLVRTVADSLMMVTLVMVSQAAMAQGFAAPVIDVVTQIQDGIYALVGVLAIIGLLWQLYEGSQGQKTWPDIGKTCLWIVAAAAVVAIGNWLWATGASISF
ncbi:hypothetical protein EV681_4574 [Advenella incenata]|uniref:Type IV secretion system protein VirB2 n=1 Tax=Advenella incenata TaxID=267800 RepID=A0A4Q7V3Q8_9BURK|nr:TrbC/VirB2 family protein [Advenella incenata]RZT91051.1 hypothetical protein EV681_4574 [Advenella incenata]